jgi:16S rRNA processing protein RimM
MITDTGELITIGKIAKPFGVRGEVRVLSLSDVPDRFRALGQVTLVDPSGRAVTTTVKSVREDRGAFIIGVEALSNPEEAAVFRGGWIKIHQDQALSLPEGQYFEFQLIGMAVFDETGQLLGTLEDVLETGSNAVFVVRGEGGETLVPGIRDAIESVNVRERTMAIRSAFASLE